MPSFSEIVVVYPFLDVGLIIVFILIIWMMWSNANLDAREQEVGERALGQAPVIGLLQGIITAGTLVLGAIGAVVALKGQFGGFSKWHIIWASAFSLFSVASSVWTLSMLPHRAVKQNVVKSFQVTFVFTLATFFLVAGCVRFTLGIMTLMIR